MYFERSDMYPNSKLKLSMFIVIELGQIYLRSNGSNDEYKLLIGILILFTTDRISKIDF